MPKFTGNRKNKRSRCPVCRKYGTMKNHTTDENRYVCTNGECRVNTFFKSPKIKS